MSQGITPHPNGESVADVTPDDVRALVRDAKAMSHESGGDAHPHASEMLLADKKYPEDEQPRDLHVCMGLNACRHQDKDGKAEMAGTGQCATVQHVCHGEGACRGQGGCGYAGSDFQQAHPGEQACRWNGSCASPINESRVFCAGPYKGKSVWKTARKLFEGRMYEAGIAFGPSPGAGIEDNLVPAYDKPKP
ncbi:hypothetical protein ACO0M4_15940 [Streptomyces sp. RGM 3693]|uniref:hypothetical protein n=1 Tax=Streptomyces sp. RGM 3693 TaxID=3413284 RepID=UPI003D2BB744